MAADELDDEERALLDQHRAKKRKDAEADREVWIRQGDNEAALPYSKARGWVQRTFGIDLDDEPVQEQPDAAPGSTQTPAADEGVRRFGGRRVS
jgi:hypothetical protein